MQDGAARRAISKSTVIIIALLLIGAGLIGYSAYGYFTASKAKAQLFVQAGDQVYVNYTGQYSSGLVFDTSMLSVAQNNATFPKAPGFTWRGASGYTPLQVSDVGAGQVVKGFDQALVGMLVNQTRTVVISPADGYGPLNGSLLAYIPIYQNISMVHTVSTSSFQSYFSESPYLGLVTTDKFWGWNVQVLNTGNGTVTYQYQPRVGMTVYPYTQNSSTTVGLSAFPVKVLSVNSAAFNGTGVIQVKNEITQSMVKLAGGKSPTGQQFIIWSVNSNGTATLNFNQPVVGRTLIFTITVTYISNPTTGKKVGIPGAVIYAADATTEL